MVHSMHNYYIMFESKHCLGYCRSSLYDNEPLLGYVSVWCYLLQAMRPSSMS